MSMRILQIEDDPFIAELTQIELARQKIPCEWITADTGAAFAQALHEGGFDLIVSDFSVPGMDGRSALALAKKRAPDIPFVFVSGTSDAGVIAECLGAGAAGFISKDELWKLADVVRGLSEKTGE